MPWALEETSVQMSSPLLLSAANLLPLRPRSGSVSIGHPVFPPHCLLSFWKKCPGGFKLVHPILLILSKCTIMDTWNSQIWSLGVHFPQYHTPGHPPRVPALFLWSVSTSPLKGVSLTALRHLLTRECLLQAPPASLASCTQFRSLGYYYYFQLIHKNVFFISFLPNRLKWLKISDHLSCTYLTCFWFQTPHNVPWILPGAIPEHRALSTAEYGPNKQVKSF